MDTADAKKAEGVSVGALHTPKPPFPAGIDAWNWWLSLRY